MRLFSIGCLLAFAAIIAITVLPNAALAAAHTGTVAYIGTDNNVYIAKGDAKPNCLTCPIEGEQVRRETVGRFETAALKMTADPANAKGSQYGWPTFSPDGKRIAYASATPSKMGMSFGLWVYDLASRNATEIFASPSEPIDYIYWLPDGNQLSFLLGQHDQLSLMLAETEGHVPIRIVLSGRPIYFGWSATPGHLVVHTAGSDPDASERVEILSLGRSSQSEDKVLSRGRAPFMTPCWSPDGKSLAWIANNHAESNLVVGDAEASHPRSIASLAVGDSTFIWSPDSHHLAYSTTLIPHDPVFQGIRLVDSTDASERILTKDPVAAFFFSPDGKFLAYISVPEDKPYYVWHVIDLKTGKDRELGKFISTQEEATAYRFFGQLALSHRIWSPDSSAIVYAGVRLLAEPPNSLNVTPPPSVWAVPISGAAPRKVGDGVVAFYSPASD